ncbi:MAG: PBP1A family penicillin-binding protein [bacterium]|nr:PBP1A family penicillin-binding protein [bacterium]
MKKRNALKRRLPTKKPIRSRWMWLRWTLAIISFCFGIGLAYLGWLARDLPSATRLQVITQSLKTQVLDMNGDVYGSFGIENRVAIPLADMPPYLVQAVLSIEDRRFYDHWGIDLIRWPKVLLTDIKIRMRSRTAPLHGASTLTQQLARDLFLTKDQRISRKLKELMLSLKIEQTYSKDEILTMYLNQIYYGVGAYGVEATTQTLFGKPCSELKIEEAVLIISLAKNPWGYDPIRFPERSLKRRNLGLTMLRDNEAITSAECDSLRLLPLGLFDRSKSKARSGSYYLEFVRKYLQERYGSESLYRDGLTVYTSINPTAQLLAEAEMEKYMLFLEERMGYENTYANVSARLDSGLVVPAADQYLQGAVILLDPADGAIRAMVGGRDFRQSEWNRAIQAPRRPGSTFKTFTYLAAIENGLAPSDKIMDTPLVINIPGQRPYKVRNHSGKFLGEITLRYALNKSINAPAIRLGQRLGTITIIDYARRLGVESHLPNVPSLPLGAGEVNLIEMATAYGTLAAGGIRIRPFAVEKVVDRYGRVLEQNEPEHTEVLDPKSNYIITNMLETAIDKGTGIRARRVGFQHPAAGKTGTTDHNHDAWFIGYTKQYVCGVWVGFDEEKSMGSWMEGSHAALPIWAEVMKQMHAGLEHLPFEAPEGVVRQPVCDDSGLLPTQYCPSSTEEVFIAGSEPRRSCDRHLPTESSFLGSGLEFRELDRQSQEESELPSP